MKTCSSPWSLMFAACLAMVLVWIGSGCGSTPDVSKMSEAEVIDLHDCSGGFVAINLDECDVERRVLINFKTNQVCTIHVTPNDYGNIWVRHAGELATYGADDTDDFTDFGNRLDDDGVSWHSYANAGGVPTHGDNLQLYHFVNFEMDPNALTNPTADFRFRLECVEMMSFGI